MAIRLGERPKPAALLSFVETDSAPYGVGRTAVRSFLLWPWIGAVLVAATALHRPLFRLLTKEDRILEWLQFAAFLAAAIVAAWVVMTLRRRQEERRTVVLWGLFSLGCFFIAGEEIAWGQRLLGLETPEALDEINQQGEITTHNIHVVQDVINLVFMVVGFYGSVVSGVVRWRTRESRSELVELLTPPLFLASLFLIVFGYKLSRYVALQEARFLVVKYGEYIEFCLAVAFLAFAWFTLQRLQRQQQPAAA